MRGRPFTRSIILATTIALVAGPSAAAVTGSAFASYDQGGQPTVSTSEPTLPAVAEQRIGFDAGTDNIDGDDGFARAQQTAFGFSNVRADGNFYNPGDSDPANTFDPAVSRNVLVAETVFRETVTNTSGATQSYAFDVFLKNMFVDIYDFGGASSSPNPFDTPASETIGGRISYDVSINGATIFAFVAEVFGGNGGVSVDQTKGTDGIAPDGTPVSSVFTQTLRSEPDRTAASASTRSSSPSTPAPSRTVRRST